MTVSLVRRIRGWLLLLSLMPLTLTAQEAEPSPFTSDLFGGLTGTDILPKGRLQWETHAFYEHNAMFGEDADTWSPNTSVLRYGIRDNLELSLQAALLLTSDEGRVSTGVSDIAVGFKTCLFDGWKAVPSIALRGLLYIPGGEHYSYLPDNFGFRLDAIFRNHLTSWCDLGYMGSVIWDDTPRPTTFFGANLDFFLSDRLVLTVEEDNYYYGANEDEKLQPWASLTLSYQVHSRVELGLATDISLRHTKDFFNVMVGVAWQLTKN